MKFPLSHTALYAKGWYKRFNPKSTKRKTIWCDLRQTLSADGYQGELMTEHDIMAVILHRCQEYIDSNDFANLVSLIDGIKPENCWKYGFYTKEYVRDCWMFIKDREKMLMELPDWSMNEAVVWYCLSSMARLDRTRLEPDIKPSPEVLPLANKVKDSMIKTMFR